MSFLFYLGVGVMFLLLPAQVAAETITPSAYHLMATYTDDRSYSQVTWLTTHNAFVNARDGWLYTQQTLGIKEQFDYGVRSFMIDAHPYGPGAGQPPYLALCHGWCPEPGSFSSFVMPQGVLVNRIPTSLGVFLRDIYDLLVSFPQEIITLHLESYTPDKPTIETLRLSHYFTKAKLDPYLLHLAPEKVDPNDPALTLGKMREWNRRLVVFSDKKHDKVFPVNLYRETQYSLKDYKNCEMRAEGRDTTRSKRLFVFNHFYTLSYESLPLGFDEINSFLEIKRRLELCWQQEETYPTFVTVDFVDKGDGGGAREAVLWLNYAATNRTLAGRAFSRGEPPTYPAEAFEETPSYHYWLWAFEYVLATFNMIMLQIEDFPGLALLLPILVAWTSTEVLTDPFISHYVPAALTQYAYPFIITWAFFNWVYPNILRNVPRIADGVRRQAFTLLARAARWRPHRD